MFRQAEVRERHPFVAGVLYEGGQDEDNIDDTSSTRSVCPSFSATTVDPKATFDANADLVDLGTIKPFSKNSPSESYYRGVAEAHYHEKEDSQEEKNMCQLATALLVQQGQQEATNTTEVSLPSSDLPVATTLSGRNMNNGREEEVNNSPSPANAAGPGSPLAQYSSSLAILAQVWKERATNAEERTSDLTVRCAKEGQKIHKLIGDLTEAQWEVSSLQDYIFRLCSRIRELEHGNQNLTRQEKEKPDTGNYSSCRSSTEVSTEDSISSTTIEKIREDEHVDFTIHYHPERSSDIVKWFHHADLHQEKDLSMVVDDDSSSLPKAHRLQTMLDESRSALSKLRFEHSRLQTRNENLSQQLMESSDRQSSLEADFQKELETASEMHQQELTSLRRALDKANTERREITSKLQELSRELKVVKDQRDTAEEASEQIKQQVKELTTHLEDITTSKAELEASFHSQWQEIMDLLLKEQLSSQEKEDTLKKHIEAMTSEKVQLKLKLECAFKQVESSQAELQFSETQRGALQSDLERKRETLLQLSGKHAALSGAQDDIKKDLAIVRKQLVEAQATEADLRHELRQANELVIKNENESKTEVEAFEKQLELQGTTILQLETHVSNLERRSLKMSNSNEALSLKVSSFKADLLEAEAANQEAHEKLHLSEEKVLNLQLELEKHVKTAGEEKRKKREQLAFCFLFSIVLFIILSSICILSSKILLNSEFMYHPFNILTKPTAADNLDVNKAIRNGTVTQFTLAKSIHKTSQPQIRQFKSATKPSTFPRAPTQGHEADFSNTFQLLDDNDNRFCNDFRKKHSREKRQCKLFRIWSRLASMIRESQPHAHHAYRSISISNP